MRGAVGEIGAVEVRRATSAVVAALSQTEAGWAARVPTLRWTVERTVIHTIDALEWYANLLEDPLPTPLPPSGTPPSELVERLAQSGERLASTIKSMPPDRRLNHSWGVADRTGLAAMGCDEALVHCYDACRGLKIAFEPPRSLCRAVLDRIFPWAPKEGDAFELLLWANGRKPFAPLPKLPQRWRWHSAPLSEWDGEGPKVGGPRRQLVTWRG